MKPTLKDAVAGDITAAMPYRAMTHIIEFIKMLDLVKAREATGMPIVSELMSCLLYTSEGTRYKGEEGGAGEFKAVAFRSAGKTGAPVAVSYTHLDTAHS